MWTLTKCTNDVRVNLYVYSSEEGLEVVLLNLVHVGVEFVDNLWATSDCESLLRSPLLCINSLYYCWTHLGEFIKLYASIS